MKRINKYLALILALCMGTYGLPALAAPSPASFKASLSDQAMARAVGGTYEARIVKPLRGSGNVKVQALVINMGGSVADGTLVTYGCDAYYALEVLDASTGTVLQTVATGTVLAGTTKLVEGTALAANNQYNNYTRVTMACTYVPGLAAHATTRYQ